MSTFKPIDGSKEDFRKYLDRKGVLDAITKVLIKCNADRPENAIEFLLDNLGEKLKDKDTIARLESDLNDAQNEIEVLKREISSLKSINSTMKKLEETVITEKIVVAVEEVATEKEETPEKQPEPAKEETPAAPPQIEPDSSTSNDVTVSDPKEETGPE